MKVKEVRAKIGSLEQLYSNAIKIQNCCMNNESARGAVKDIEKESCINTTLRTFATFTATIAADEIKRLSNILDNADIKID